MTSLGLQGAQLLSSVRIGFGHICFTELCDFVRAIGNSYRLASTTGGGSGAVYGRFAAGFCRAAVARLTGAPSAIMRSPRLQHALIESDGCAS
jgi:hypothetical protein